MSLMRALRDSLIVMIADYLQNGQRRPHVGRSLSRNAFGDFVFTHQSKYVDTPDHQLGLIIRDISETGEIFDGVGIQFVTDIPLSTWRRQITECVVNIFCTVFVSPERGIHTIEQAQHIAYGIERSVREALSVGMMELYDYASVPIGDPPIATGKKATWFAELRPEAEHTARTEPQVVERRLTYRFTVPE